MSDISVRTIHGNDFFPIVELWNETHPYDPITPRIFKRKVLLDVCFDAEGFLIAESEGKLWGFIYAVRRLRPLDNDFSPIPAVGWVNAFGVLPDAPAETAPMLLSAADDYAKKHGLEKLCATAYSPFYFTQGFDIQREKEAINAFLASGYEYGEVSYARDVDLLDYTVPEAVKNARKAAEAEGFTFGALREEQIVSFWDYLNRYQSAGWRNRVRELMYDNDDYGRIRVITYAGEIVGFCVFNDPDGSPERFGPFGVRECFRGRKLGQILLSDCLTEMKKRGLHNAWMQWTESGNAADHVYTAAGFRITRSHITMEKKF